MRLYFIQKEGLIQNMYLEIHYIQMIFNQEVQVQDNHSFSSWKIRHDH